MSTRRVPVLLVALVGGALTLGGCSVLAGEEMSDTRTVDGDVTAVQASGGAGSVTVRGSAGASGVTVARTVHFRGGQPSGRWDDVSGTVLRLEGSCGDDCWVDYTVTLPEAVDVSASLGSGDVRLSGVGEVEVSTGSGDVEVRGASGRVLARTGSGDLSVDDAGASVTARAGSGEIEVAGARDAVTTQAGSGDTRIDLASVVDVRAQTSSGDLAVTVPAEAEYRVSADVGSGNRAVAVPSRPDAAHRLELVTGSGDLSVATR